MAAPPKPPWLPKKPKQTWLDTGTQDTEPNLSALDAWRDAHLLSGPTSQATTSISNNHKPQMISQHPLYSLNPTNPLPAPQAMMRPLIPPYTGVSGVSAPPMMAENAPRASNTDTGEPSSNSKNSSGMPYEPKAMPPATRREHSIYPVDSQGRKSVHPGLSTDQSLRPSTLEEWEKASREDVQVARERERLRMGFQFEICREGQRLQAEKDSKVDLPSRETAATSDSTNTPERNTGHQSDVASGGSASSENSQATSEMDPMLIDWDDEEEDFRMLDDTPEDRSMVEEIIEEVSPPFNVTWPDQIPSISELSSITKWDPELDEAFQMDAQGNSENLWQDLRFHVPQTPADIDSLQHALEITRMDFWIRNPIETYPRAELSQYKTESYGSQQRRLQHAFCRIWLRVGSGPVPELYRLPSWMFGFDKCYWTPSHWGIDLRSNAYVQGLADMAAARNERSLRSMDLRSWKARLEEQVAAATAHCTTELALYAGPKKT